MTKQANKTRHSTVDNRNILQLGRDSYMISHNSIGIIS